SFLTWLDRSPLHTSQSDMAFLRWSHLRTIADQMCLAYGQVRCEAERLARGGRPTRDFECPEVLPAEQRLGGGLAVAFAGQALVDHRLLVDDRPELQVVAEVR